VLAAVCAERGIRLVTFSSDLVFDGTKGRPYVESDPTGPLNVYGRTKVEGERLALEAHDGALVVRTGAFFGPWDRHNFVTLALERIASGEGLCAPEDQVVSPTYVPDLVQSSLDLLIDGERGIWHLANRGEVTWAALARLAAQAAGLDPSLVRGVATSVLALPAPRPRYSALASERGWLMPAWHDALGRYARAHETNWNELPSGSIAVRALR
jgi:dTDP-4-dehydrorhamnose reductase